MRFSNVKKFFAILLTLVMVISIFGGCSFNKSNKQKKHKVRITQEDDTNETDEVDPLVTTDITDVVTPVSTEGKIGISFPTKDLRFWHESGENIKDQLVGLGYEVDLHYANNDIYNQISDIEWLISSDCKVLIIAPIDSDYLADTLELAKERGITVVSYQRFINNSDAVSYYINFDNYMTGVIQAQYIIDTLDLDNSNETYYIEIFTGDSGDIMAQTYYYGAMDTLQPYFMSGQLVAKSGETNFSDVATGMWMSIEAEERMDEIISKYYSDGTNLDVLLCTNDSTAYGAYLSLEENYTGTWPIITGQDCDILNVKNIMNGYQSMSVFKNPVTLQNQTVSMIVQIMNDKEVIINTYTESDGVSIPTYLCEPVYVDKNNIEEQLIDSGYYTKDELGL